MELNNLSLLDGNETSQIQWRIAPTDEAQANALAAELNISRNVAGLYLRLGLDTAEKITAFNQPEADALHSPWLLPDMKAATDRLNCALDAGETIHVHGDYDADGVTATAVVVYALRKLGGNVTYHLPHRLHDGYGLSVEAVERAKRNGAMLLLSVDCGTEAHEAVHAAREAGIDIIVTDHHEPEPELELPPCVAIVNPNRADAVYPFRGLSGVGVAFKTMLALCERRKLPLTNVRNRLLEFVALGTIVDMAPLVDENRVLVQLGLEQLRQTQKLGLRALLQTSGILDSTLLSSASIAFQIGPRLNAPGRVDDPQYALDLLLAQEETAARQGATRLEGFNRQRKLLQAQTEAEAFALLSGESSSGTAIVREGVITVVSSDWQPGILGPLASEIAEKWGRPALAARVCPDGTLIGSCRSPRSVPILHALKSPDCKELLIRCGGHAFAAGFALPAENLPLLAERLDAWIGNYRQEQTAQAEATGGQIAPPALDFDGEFGVDDVTLDTLRVLAHLAPFREDRTQPLLLFRNLRVVRAQTVKKGEHLKLHLRDESSSNTLTVMAWGRGADAPRYPTGCRIDLAANLTCDTHDGFLSAQLQAQEIRLSQEHQVIGDSLDKF